MELIKPKKNFQIYPAKQMIVPNDRISKRLFSLTLEDIQDWIAQQNVFNLIEIQKYKKYGRILSPMKLSVEDETFTISEPLDQFHCAVLCAGISEMYVGNHQTTPAIIYRAITGKVEKGTDAKPNKKQLADILRAFELLMRIQLTYDMSNYCQTTGCNEGNSAKLVNMLLPCSYLQATTINGKDASVIELLAQSPLLESAQIKNNQILTYDNSLLDVRNMNNSRMNIAAKHYMMRRVCEISLHRQMSPTIKLADYFKKLRIEEAHAQVKKDAREVLVTFFKHLQAKEIIKSFELTKKGNTFDALHFTACKTAKKAKSRR